MGRKASGLREHAIDWAGHLGITAIGAALAKAANAAAALAVIGAEAAGAAALALSSANSYTDIAVNVVTGKYAGPKQTVAELRAVLAASRADKQLRLVEDKGALYRFDTAGTGPDDGEGTIVPSDVTPPALGRWFKVQAATQDHEGLAGLLGGGANDHQHLTTAGLARAAAAPNPGDITAGHLLGNVGGAWAGMDPATLGGGIREVARATGTTTHTWVSGTKIIDDISITLATSAANYLVGAQLILQVLSSAGVITAKYRIDGGAWVNAMTYTSYNTPAHTVLHAEMPVTLTAATHTIEWGFECTFAGESPGAYVANQAWVRTR